MPSLQSMQSTKFKTQNGFTYLPKKVRRGIIAKQYSKEMQKKIKEMSHDWQLENHAQLHGELESNFNFQMQRWRDLKEGRIDTTEFNQNTN